jgi:hypothetical protein
MKDSQELPWRCLVLLAGIPLIPLGCGGPSPPPPANPEQARAALRLALDAWQKGAAPESLKHGAPAIRVIDHEWATGCRLLRYQVEKDTPLGANLHCHVHLSLQNTRGKMLQKKARYNVATGSVVTVFREEGP